jgi:hypothetical protein
MSNDNYSAKTPIAGLASSPIKKTSLKKHCNPFSLPFGILLLGIITSCSTAQTKPVATKVPHEKSQAMPSKHKVASPSFIGNWLNEGELCGLHIKKGGSCSLWYHEGEKEIRIEGTWEQKGRILTVNYNKEWWGSRGKTQTYYFVRKNWGGGKWQDLLSRNEVELDFAFYRVSPKD